MKYRYLALLMPVLLAGCTQHPPGEMQLRRTALKAGRPFIPPFAQRHLQPLPIKPTTRQLVDYALLNNPRVQQTYWKWRAAIEQIPQAGTEPTTVMLNAGTLLTNGTASLANSTLGVANMGSADIRWPSKMSVQARRALQAAYAAGWQYQSARYRLRRRVLNAWYRLVRTALLLKLQRHELTLVHTVVLMRQAAVSTGSHVRGWLTDMDSVDTLQLRITSLQSQMPIFLARLNALLGRAADAPLNLPPALPAAATPRLSDAALWSLALRRNPGLHALERLQKAGHLSIRRARLQYIPNFDLGLSSSLDGTVQNLTGALVVPLFQYQAINASIAQAQNNLRSTNAALRNQDITLAARLLIDLTAFRNDQARLRIFAGQILPRIKVLTSLARTDYQQGTATIREQIQAENMELRIRTAILKLHADALERRADIEAVIATPLIGAGRTGAGKNNGRKYGHTPNIISR